MPHCTGCLTAQDTVSLADGAYTPLFEELTNVILTDDAAGPRLCLACAALLHKCVEFRRKLIRSHKLLLQYADSQLPYPVSIAHLTPNASWKLSKSNTLILNTMDTEEHKNINELHNMRSHYEIVSNELNEIKPELNLSDDDRDFGTELQVLEVKETFNTTTFPEVFVKDEVFIEDSTDRLEIEIHLEKREHIIENETKVKRKNYVRDLNRVPQSKRRSNKNALCNERAKRDRIPLDPSKVRTLKFTHDDQLRHMEEKRKDPNFLKFPYKCQLCCTGFNYEEKLQEHCKDKHEERTPGEKWYKCDICHFYIRKYHSWKSHMYMHATVYECTICGLRGYKKTPMIEHYSYKHEGTLVPYICNVCGKCFGKKTLFLNHMRNHANEQQVQCDHCKREYSRKDKLIVHMRQHYEDPSSRPFVCPCGYRARTAKLLEAHAVKHSSERPQYCVECDRHFKTDKSLHMHLLKDPAHADPSNFKFHCPECPRRYALRVELKYHTEREHLGIKHKCLECGKAFSYPESLVRHTKFVHEGVKQDKIHGCEVCNKMFSTTSQLRKHSRVHTGERPYVCAHCPAAFAQTGTRATHVRLVHLKLRKNKPGDMKKDDQMILAPERAQ